ncbi:MAG: TRAP transporter substrate-binding protein [Lachnospira sp.]|nr:TRAP transporter substrate-binding protein [Lachnospira sp.]
MISAAVIAVAVIFASCRFCQPVSGKAPELVLTYAENQPEDYPTTQGARYFARRVEEESDGRIRIQIYTDGAMGDEDSVVSQIRFGGIDMARVSLATITRYSSIAMVLMMPYLFRDSRHMWEVLDGEIGDEIMDSFDGSGLQALSWYDAGVRSFYSSREIRSLDDFSGRTVRVQYSDVMKDMVSALGATPVPMSYGSVYAALQQGTVDIAENNWSSYVSMKHDQVAPYFLEDEHNRIPELQIISQSTMNRLSADDQKLLSRCAKESAEYERQLWSEWEKKSRQEALENGCQVIALTGEQKAEFREACQPLYDKYCAESEDLVQRIEETGEAA